MSLYSSNLSASIGRSPSTSTSYLEVRDYKFNVWWWLYFRPERNWRSLLDATCRWFRSLNVFVTANSPKASETKSSLLLLTPASATPRAWFFTRRQGRCRSSRCYIYNEVKAEMNKQCMQGNKLIETNGKNHHERTHLHQIDFPSVLLWFAGEWKSSDKTSTYCSYFGWLCLITHQVQANRRVQQDYLMALLRIRNRAKISTEESVVIVPWTHQGCLPGAAEPKSPPPAKKRQKVGNNSRE